MVFVLFVIRKTYYRYCCENDEVSEVENFMYLGSVLQKISGFKEDVMHRIECWWIYTHMCAPH